MFGFSEILLHHAARVDLEDAVGNGCLHYAAGSGDIRYALLAFFAVDGDIRYALLALC